jgi:membrane associated rhomboid family serine protease
MTQLDNLERRFGAWAIPQFPLFIVMANGLIYILAQVRPDFLLRLLLDPVAIRQGEIWRIFTFLFVPPMMGPLWMVFWLLLLYQFSQALEQEWGEFRFCLFYAIGALATIVAALWIVGDTLSNVPLNTTLFLAFATLFPNFELLLFFILPVKVKYLALLTWIGLAVALVMGSSITRVAIAASLVNYVVFFGPQIWETITLKITVYKARRRFHESNNGKE